MKTKSGSLFLACFLLSVFASCGAPSGTVNTANSSDSTVNAAKPASVNTGNVPEIKREDLEKETDQLQKSRDELKKELENTQRRSSQMHEKIRETEREIRKSDNNSEKKPEKSPEKSPEKRPQ